MSNSGDGVGRKTLRVLALDGGGVRGLSSLLILERLIYQLKPEQDPKRRLRPCEIFDIIAGTSTGGLIALMLGRLEMDIESCIDAYVDISKDVFNPRKRMRLGGSVLQNILGQATFSATKLEDKIKELVRKHARVWEAGEALESSVSTSASVSGEGAQTARSPDVMSTQICSKFEDTPLMAGNNQRCKVFVCTTAADGSALRLRSYSSKYSPGYKCTIWEAARATSAAPTFFEPIMIKGVTTLRDGGLRNNNPILELINEVQVEFDDCEISCIVSIGTGVGKKEIFKHGLIDIAKACARIATDTEQAEANFRNTYASKGKIYEDCYFRYEVQQGLQDVGMEEWKKLDDLRAVTFAYLDDGKQRESFSKCILRLGGPKPGAEPIPEPPHSSGEALIRHYEFLGLQPTPWFAPRSKILHDMELILIPEEHGKVSPTIVALTGLGGVGKTQLMLRYAEDHRDYYSATFWVDARTDETMQKSFADIAQLLMIGSAERVKTDIESTALIRQSDVENVHAFKVWLRHRRGPWLLLFDNLVDPLLMSSLYKYFPNTGKGSIIVSSRRRGASEIGRSLEIAGLEMTPARELLFHYAQIFNPSLSQIKDADKIVEQVDCLPLAIALAGNYIQVLGGLDRYLITYKKQKESLLRRALGVSISKDYPLSIIAAWQISFNHFTNKAKQLFHLICFLDPTNITAEFFRRACTPKWRWNKDGKLIKVTPEDNGIPGWLLENLQDDYGNWDELSFLESVHTLETLFFVSRESAAGPWLHNDKVIEGTTNSLVIRVGKFVHEIGRLMLNPKEVQDFVAAAICLAVYAMDDSAETSTRSPKTFTDPSYRAILHLPTGGAMKNSSDILLSLEETFGHLHTAVEAFEPLAQLLDKQETNILSRARYSKAVRCWAFLFGLSYNCEALPSSNLTIESLSVATKLATVVLRAKPSDVPEDSLRFWLKFNYGCWMWFWALWNRRCWDKGQYLIFSLSREYSLFNEHRFGQGEFPEFSFPYAFLCTASFEDWLEQNRTQNPFCFEDKAMAARTSMSNYLESGVDFILRQTLRKMYLEIAPAEKSDDDPLKVFSRDAEKLDWPEARKVSKELTNWAHNFLLSIPKELMSDELQAHFKSQLYQDSYVGIAMCAAFWMKMPVEKLLSVNVN